MRTNQKGNSSIIIVIVILILLIIGASAASYYLLKSQGKAPQIDYGNLYNPQSYSTNPPQYAVSDDDSLDTIETELETTTEGDIDSDIKELNSSASPL